MTGLDRRLSRARLVRGALALGATTALGGRTMGAAASEYVGTITDDAGHAMPYAWRPAADPPNARTLVWLHAHGGNEDFAPYADPAWNVLVPLDRYGWRGKGSWWLGEGGDFFVLRLLNRLIDRIRGRIGGDRGLYFAGGSMGGFGAILFGTTLGARAVYANAFQSKLRGTAMTDDYLGAATAQVVGGVTSRFADLCALVRTRDPAALPLYCLGFNRYDHEDYGYFGEHFVPFVAACATSGANAEAEVFPVAAHADTRTFAGVLALFDAWG